MGGKSRLTFFSILALLCLLPITGFSVLAEEDYSPSMLSLYVYSDGGVSIKYLVEVDPTRAQVNITLFGEDYEELIVKDQDERLLDYSIYTSWLTIDTLGSMKVDIYYTTHTLTNKTRSLWTLGLSSPINTNIYLPEEASIMGLYPTPMSISTLENKAVLMMPAGEIEVSYLIGVTGTREHALLLINQAETRIDEAENEGIIVDDAKALLEQAKQAYHDAQYNKAEELANNAENSVAETVVLAQEAKAALDEAEDSIESAQEAGRTSLLEQAGEELQQGWEAYNLGDYEEGKAYAEQAAATAQQSKSRLGFFTPQFIAVLGLSAILALILLLVFARKRKGRGASIQRKGFKFDLESIFEQHPSLRLDEREVIRFIAESGNGVFASEIREGFDLARSSAWRMINRLEEEEIVRTRIVGRETFAQINPKYRLKRDKE